MKKRILLTVLVVLLTPFFIFADESLFIKSDLYPEVTRLTLEDQLNLGETSAARPDDSAIQAMSNTAYMVTPGDIYTLSYINTSYYSNYTTHSFQVDSNCRVNVPYIGVIDAKGMSYVDFKAFAEEQLNVSHSELRAQISFTSCGTFNVYVTGEVEKNVYVNTWRLARLSDLCSYATEFASTRSVEVEYKDGTKKSYDLYKAFYQGSEDQNPYLEPGCKVTFKKAERTVFVSGNVKRPGEYQILENETLENLIYNYAGGVDYNSDLTAITYASLKDGSYSAHKIDYNKNKNYVLKDMDSISVGSKNQVRNYITISGAVQSSETDQSGKFNYIFYEGETAEQVVRSIQDKLLTNSDIENIYILRDGKKIQISAEDIFSESSNRGTKIMEGDTLIVPYSQQYVTISGAVSKPGNYPYEPDKDYNYYIGLAGGLSSDARRGSIKLTSYSGRQMKLTGDITPGSTISIARRNTNAAAAITLSISIVTFCLSLINIFD